MDYKQLIKDQKDTLSQLHQRMAADVELLHLSKYKVTDSKGKAIPDIINVTLNRPAIFGANVVASLSNAKQQVVVEADSETVDTRFIEKFLVTAVETANRRRWKRGQPLLDQFADAQLCFRGRTGRRVLLWEKNGEVVCNITPWDGRYMFYEPAEDGLEWAAYQTIRTKAMIEAEYGITIKDTKDIVTDVWDTDHNEVWIGKDKVRSEGHPFGFTPVVAQTVMLGYGPMLLDEGWQTYEGESIFFMIRDIVPEMNRLASILQTLNFNELKVALQFSNPDGTPQDEPPDRPAMGDMVSTGKGKIMPINLGEARLAAQMLYAMMAKAFQEGSYTDIDIGNPQQPFSAVALITIGESKDMVYLPRLAAKEQLNVATAEMLIKQALQIGGSIELGRPGHKVSFPTAKLKGQYDINYRYFVRSPKIDVARMALANASMAWYPRKYVYAQILQDEDPDRLLRQWYDDEAERVSPTVKMHRIIRNLLERAEKDGDEDAAREAQLLAMELGATIEQIQAGAMAEKPKGIESPKQLIPLLPPEEQIGGVSSNKAASMLQQTPQTGV